MVEGKLSVDKITDLAMLAVKRYIAKEPETIISVGETDGEWRVIVEVLERKAVPNTQDLLGRYEVKFSMDGVLLGWSQRMVRKRADRMMPADEEWFITG